MKPISLATQLRSMCHNLTPYLRFRPCHQGHVKKGLKLHIRMTMENLTFTNLPKINHMYLYFSSVTAIMQVTWHLTVIIIVIAYCQNSSAGVLSLSCSVKLDRTLSSIFESLCASADKRAVRLLVVFIVFCPLSEHIMVFHEFSQLPQGRVLTKECPR